MRMRLCVAATNTLAIAFVCFVLVTSRQDSLAGDFNKFLGNFQPTRLKEKSCFQCFVNELLRLLFYSLLVLEIKPKKR